ncbi:FYVE zinc finger-domain-containing protein [Coprinopsis sp. MPI-PUGE-AT-0042]|nr:FYVE zinc finger-domain-containing protein [Coprinopsis sp. MPI-PUGE-AT-0042]
MPEPTSPPTSPKYVPYQAYKPKRHSRNLSNATVPTSRPASIVGSPATSPVPRALLDEDRDSLASFSLAGNYGTPPSAGVRSPQPPQSPSPSIRVDLVPDEQPSDTNGHYFQKSPVSNGKSPATLTQAETERNGGGVASAAPVTAPSLLSPTSPLASPSQSAKPRKTTTFRRITPRSTSVSLSGTPPTHSRTSSTSSLPSPADHRFSSSLAEVSDRVRTPPPPSPLPRSPLGTQKPLPYLPPQPSPLKDSPQITPTPSGASIRSPSTIAQTLSQGSSVASPSRPSSALPRPDGSTSTTPTILSPSAPSQRIPQAPYRPGFQPKGAYRQRTDEYLSVRKIKRAGEGEEGRLMRIERTKLERRLEKLIALHFPPPGTKKSMDSPIPPHIRKEKNAPSALRRASSFFDIDKMKSLKLNDPSELWRGVMGDAGGKDDVRAAEQRITPWEDDNAASKCPLCQTSFHPLTNRKHHCRLCGKIICSLPQKVPHRPVMCSLLFVVDSKTRQIEEVGEGVDYGVRRRNRPESEDKFLKAVRICRSCRPVLMHERHSQQAEEVPLFFKLYDVFINLEKEIEDALPQFQELLLSLSHNDQPTKEASTARKRLLEAFAQYDKLSKQIRALPCPNGPGSSQDRIQASIATRANLFLQKNMFPLQSLPRPAATPTASTNGKEQADPLDIDPDSELARTLQPLLEQEALLDSFIEEAKAQRKFEDVKTLKMNQNEIRREIEHLFQATNVDGPPRNSKR